ncbi:hypothetical protein PIB30_025243 [Stylosanthes scabra]|uniref:Uncharacterized protein n=1 Tax=Stylosanthes scabra TaxID=79078 RepID=A0ABU6SA50_9FABA|nr:hypothetical protein [Stylosanthes scabra]
MPPVRVTVPSSSAATERRSFFLNLPRNAISRPHYYLQFVASISFFLLIFVCGFLRLGQRLIFVDENGRTHHMTLHKGRFSGTIIAGIGELMRFYNLTRGDTAMARYAGRNFFHIRVSGLDGVAVA